MFTKWPIFPAPAVRVFSRKPFPMSSSAPLSRRHFLAASSAAATLNAGPRPEDVVAGASTDTLDDPNGSSKSQHITRTIADWVVNSRLDGIPAAVRKEAVRSIVNSVGATVGGSADETVTIALRALAAYSGPAPASLFGRDSKLDPLKAALINGISSHVLDYDDTELKTIIHPAGVVALALFSLAADHPITGAQFLHAFVVGTEVECRLGNTIYPSHYDLGWHITATCGVFGAAAACGKLLGLDSQKMVWALGAAAVQAAGLKVVFGSMGKSFQVGRAARRMVCPPRCSPRKALPTRMFPSKVSMDTLPRQPGAMTMCNSRKSSAPTTRSAPTRTNHFPAASLFILLLMPPSSSIRRFIQGPMRSMR
jgi:hypothetical protein